MILTRLTALILYQKTAVLVLDSIVQFITDIKFIFVFFPED